MTVEELIEKLECFNPALEVILATQDGNYVTLNDVGLDREDDMVTVVLSPPELT